MSFGKVHCARCGAILDGVRHFLPISLLLVCSTLSCSERQSDRGKKTDTANAGSPPAANQRGPASTRPDNGNSPPQLEQNSTPADLFNAPEFELIDQNGAAVGTHELRGHVWVVNFIFTQCKATCPKQTARIAALQRHACSWPDWERVRLVSVSVDPQHDTAERLHEYAERHAADYAHWKFLTGGRDDLFRICKDGFKLPVKEGALDGSAPITHSPQFVLIDAKLQVRGYYDGLSDSDFVKLLTDMCIVLGEPAPGTEGLLHVCFPSDVFDPPWLDRRQAAQLATADELPIFHDFQFTDRIDESQIHFVSRAVTDATREWKTNHYDHGAGLAAADVDGDKLTDLYFVNQVGGNELWRNLGDGRFENITEQAGVALQGRTCVSASFADTDNDGDPDLFVTTTRHGNAFFENEGHGRFRNATPQSGLEYTGHSSSAEFFDYDRDGRLDLFLTNVGVFTTDQIGNSRDVRNREHPYYVGMLAAFAAHLDPQRSEQSILYHNDGDNRFRDVSAEVGLIHTAWSGDATPLDANGDGWIDLYVLGMQGNDEYYENIQGRRFERKSRRVFPKSPWGAMGVKSFDYNNDGRMDLFVTNMHSDMFRPVKNGPDEKLKVLDTAIPKSVYQGRNIGRNIFGNAFYENLGEGRFKEVSDAINAETLWPWGLSVGDLNADGFQDVFITASMNFPFSYQVNSLLLNDHGKRFYDAEFVLGVEPRRNGRTATMWYECDCSDARDANSQACQGRSGRVQVWSAIGSRSSVVVDLDQDGDLDIVTNDFHSQPMVLISSLSQSQPDLRYLKIQLQGTRSNFSGLGATVQVTAAGRTATQVHDGQSGYLSQSDLPLYFGLNAAETVDRVAVLWPNGIRQALEGPIQTNQQLIIVERD